MDKDDISGWQNAYVHNARYALLIGGGSLFDNNYPAFLHDLKNMYIKLRDDYRYEEQNIFSYLWDDNTGLDFWSEGRANLTNVQQSFQSIRMRITNHDTFLLNIIAHGSGYSSEGITDASVDLYSDVGNSAQSLFFGVKNHELVYTIKEEITDEFINSARQIFIFQSCNASAGIHHLSYENSISMCAEDYRIDSWVESKGNSFTDVGSNYGQWAFLYQGTYIDWFDFEIDDMIPVKTHFPGLIPSLGDITDPQNLLYAFNKGCIAARNNFDNNPLSNTDGVSHPLLEDTYLNDTFGTRGILLPRSYLDEGWIARITYL